MFSLGIFSKKEVVIFFLQTYCAKRKKCIFAHPFGGTVVWCNGSTTGFGPVSLGSSPGRVAKFCKKLLPRVLKCGEIVIMY